MKVISSILANRLTSNPWQEQFDRTLQDMLFDAGGIEPVSSADQNGRNLTDITDRIAERVKTDGVVLFPAAVTGPLLEQLRMEFREIISKSDRSPYTVDRHEGAVCVRVNPRPSLSVQAFPATNAFFDSRVFREVAKSFYQSESDGFIFNSTIFVHETPETKSPLSGKLHWDRTQALKFWVYIDDIPLEAGPMRIQPGSTCANKAERIGKRRQSEQLEGGKDNVVADMPDDFRFLSGPAGTVLIHDTDCSHGASPVLNGQVRRIMRGQSRAAQPTRSRMLQRYLLNPQTFYRC